MPDVDSDLQRVVIEHLKNMSSPKNRVKNITGDTEIYKDLGIYGDDIVNFCWWLEKEYLVEMNIDPFKYAPREMPFFQIRNAARRALGGAPHYESLKVRDIFAAISAKRWLL
jgi:hypothetical protein